MIIGMDVPSAKTRKKDDVSPGKNRCAMLEKKKAERPKPEMTRPVVDALCIVIRDENARINETNRFIREGFSRRID
jgi:hypothetical protein